LKENNVIIISFCTIAGGKKFERDQSKLKNQLTQCNNKLCNAIFFLVAEACQVPEDAAM
jgi:hypothetical protein